MKKLFIVESPNKVATVKKYLGGSDWVVVASVGHTHLLPKKNYVDVKNGFKLFYEPDPKKKDVLQNIMKLADSCDAIYYSGDMDLEGSVLSWNLYELLSKKHKKKPHIRVNLKEITKAGIQKALNESYSIDDPKEFAIVQAGFLRRIEDRFVGFQVSPLAQIYVKQKTSAGRVQSPALRIVVEKEREIQAFVPEVYYEIFATVFKTDTKESFQIKYAKEVSDPKIATLVVEQCKGKPIRVKSVNSKQTKSSPSAPFITKTLLASASSFLGWKTKKTTQVAQNLFQAGKITYPRTDNSVVSADGQKMLADYLQQNFTPNYIQTPMPNYNNPKAKLEHEAIRPTDLNDSAILSSDEQKLYNLIKARFVASGMTSAQYESITAEIAIGLHPFKATGSVLKFDGFTKVWNYSQKQDTILPHLDETTSLDLKDIWEERKETKPPARYKGASLIEALDKLGIGKPSTMNSILEVLETREYIRYDEKGSIVPTELGMRLNDFLCKYFLKIIDFDFTAKVESDQDRVMKGELSYEEAVGEFYGHLKEEIKEAGIKIGNDKQNRESTSLVCPKCSTNLLVKKINKKTGEHFYSCGGYFDKTCFATFNIGENQEPIEVENNIEVLMDCPASECGGVLTKRVNRATKQVFYACTNWEKKNGGCKVSADENGVIKEPKKQKKHGSCDRCKKGTMVERRNKQGVIFLGCDNFPKCKNAKKLDPEESN